MTAETRFWARLTGGDGCWEWPGSRVRTGYGQVSINGRMVRTHRLAWELTHGPIPLGLEVCHKCDNPPCCRPDHLFVATHQENIADRDRKGRGKTRRGEASNKAKLTEAQVVEIKAALADGGSPTALARQYGVTKGAIQHIRRGRNWAAA